MERATPGSIQAPSLRRFGHLQWKTPAPNWRGGFVEIGSTEEDFAVSDPSFAVLCSADWRVARNDWEPVVQGEAAPHRVLPSRWAVRAAAAPHSHR